MIYTIGYTAFKIEDFILVLKKYNIDCIIDVRSSPFSRFYSDYNKLELMSRLKNEKILYYNFTNEFGARQTNRIYYHSEGYLDFNKFLNSDNFKSGVNKIKNGIKKGFVLCLMCAETDPITCHRSIMIGRGLKNNDIKVNHILKSGEFETQESIEMRLLNIYYENRNQLSLFSEVKSDIEYIKEAYDKKNKEIGFREEE